MAKKRFTAGMESLFGDTQEPLEADRLLSGKKSEKEPKTSKGKFRDDLTLFLKEAFEESIEEQLEQKAKGQPKVSKSGKSKGGLDALLRSTIEPTQLKLQNKPTRRLTIAFDEQKLKQLKSIARERKVYLKDIIDEIVGEFLSDHEED